MREILFKGKRKTKIDNNKWIVGYYQQDLKSWIAKPSMEEGFFNGYEVEPSTVCQYTGVNDNKGDMIYEGDWVKGLFNSYKSDKDKEDLYQAWQVHYCEGCFMVGTWDLPEFMNNFIDIEVIGDVTTDINTLVK